MEAGSCPKGELPASAVRRYQKRTEPPKLSRAALWAPNQLRLTDMPCGCYTLPWPVIKLLGKNIVTFICSVHGEVKLTQSWRKAKDKVLAEVLTDEPMF